MLHGKRQGADTADTVDATSNLFAFAVVLSREYRDVTLGEPARHTLFPHDKELLVVIDAFEKTTPRDVYRLASPACLYVPTTGGTIREPSSL